MLVGYGAPVESDSRPTRRARGRTRRGGSRRRRNLGARNLSRSPSTDPSQATAAASDTPVRERPRSTPPVRKLARDLGVDLTAGHRNRRRRADHPRGRARGGIRRDPSAARAGSATASGERESRTPIKGVRKHTAAAMVSSAFTAPHVTEFLTIDVTPTMDLIASLKTNRAFADYRINLLTVVAKALLVAVRPHPVGQHPLGRGERARSSSTTTSTSESRRRPRAG